MSPMECGLGNFLLTVAKKTVSAYSRLLGWVSIQVLSRTLIMQQGVTDGMRSPWNLRVKCLEEFSGADHSRE